MGRKPDQPAAADAERLERRGYVARHPDSADRRRLLVRARPVNLGRIVAIYRPMQEEMERLCARYSEAELAVLIDLAERSAEIAAEFVRSLSAGRSGAGQAP